MPIVGLLAGRPDKFGPKVMRMPTMLTRIRAVSDDADPLAHRRGLWEVVVAGQRWFGPGTLWACLQARRPLEPIVLEGLRRAGSW